MIYDNFPRTLSVCQRGHFSGNPSLTSFQSSLPLLHADNADDQGRQQPQAPAHAEPEDGKVVVVVVGRLSVKQVTKHSSYIILCEGFFGLSPILKSAENILLQSDLLRVRVVFFLSVCAVNINVDPTLQVPDIKHHVLPALAEVLLLAVLRVQGGVPTADHVDVLRHTMSVVPSRAVLRGVVEHIGVGDLCTFRVVSLVRANILVIGAFPLTETLVRSW